MFGKRKPREVPDDRDMHKLHVDYNLEKEPLRTGRKAPRVSLREKAAMGDDAQSAGWRMQGWLSLLLIVLLVIGGILGGWYAIKAFRPGTPTDGDSFKDIRHVDRAAKGRVILSSLDYRRTALPHACDARILRL